MLNYGAYELIGIMGVFGSLTIFLKVSRNMGTVRQVRLFKAVLVFYMIYAGSNYVWALGERRLHQDERHGQRNTELSGLVIP